MADGLETVSSLRPRQRKLERKWSISVFDRYFAISISLQLQPAGGESIDAVWRVGHVGSVPDAVLSSGTGPLTQIKLSANVVS